MKELVGEQVLLPAWDTWASMVAFHDGDYHAATTPGMPAGYCG